MTEINTILNLVIIILAFINVYVSVLYYKISFNKFSERVEELEKVVYVELRGRIEDLMWRIKNLETGD